MADDPSNLIVVEITPDEARLIVAALRQFEPFWPSDMGDMSRTELLSGIRLGIERVVGSLEAPRTSAASASGSASTQPR